MAKEGGGGGGAFGWTLLGILVGVAGTLAVETLLNNHHATATNDEAAVSGATVAIEAAPEAPRPVVKAPAISAAPTKSDLASPSQDDVEDDAAAAGMTSRSRPSDSSSQAGATN
jgi:hypothetical protein